MEIENVYASIKELKHDKSVEDPGSGYVILQPHQVIPKYYLFGDRSRHTLILNYSTGSGKTMTGLFTILEKLYISKINEIYPKFYIPKCLVVGEWMTRYQFRVDMSRQMFNLINQKHLKMLEEVSGTADEEEVVDRIYKSMNKLVNFYGYQSLFNALFPHYADRHVQDVSVLINDFKRGSLVLNEHLLDELKDNIIVVDEMQKLYSQSGLNTYGFALSYLSRMATKLNLKIVYMSGTIFNSSLAEISSILNLITERELFYTVDELCTTTKVLDDMIMYKLKSDETALKELENRYIYYSRGSVTADKKSMALSALKFNGHLFADGASRVVYGDNSSSNYPSEIVVGNADIDSIFNLFQVQAKSFQLKALKTVFNDDDEKALSPYDVGLPPENEWNKYGISKTADNIYSGEFLLRSKIGNYSCVAEKVIDLCLSNSFNNEKTVLYHSKLQNFGLLQYGKILELNGFVHRGYEPLPNAICKRCHLTYEKHKNTCPRFTAMYYEFLHGLQKPNERQNIVDHIYNNPNNLYGDMCSVLLISDVAYAGVSLMSTNNLGILSRVPNVSRLQQIMARIVRLKSHSALPPEKRFAKFYIFGASDSMNEKSSIFKYYKLRSLSNNEIDLFINRLKPKTIGEVLLNKPRELKLTKEEKEATSEMFYNDGKRVIENISGAVIKVLKFGWWKFDTLISRIRSNELAVSYLDISLFPETFVRKYVEEDERLELFKFANIKNEQPLFIRPINSTYTYDVYAVNKLPFSDIYTDYGEAIADYKKQMETSASAVRKRAFYSNLLDLLTLINDYSTLIDWDYFWKYTFEIHNEYYEKDEEQFITNHSSSKRSAKTIKGFYWNDKVILRDGTSKSIQKSFTSTTFHPITNTIVYTTASLGLRLTIFEKKEKKVEDARMTQRGTDCWSKKNNDLAKHYSLTQKNTVEFCGALLEALCTEQSKNSKDKFILSPFEQDINV